MRSPEISIKGVTPQLVYPTTLSDCFYEHKSVVYNCDECIVELEKLSLILSQEEIYNSLFSYRINDNTDNQLKSAMYQYAGPFQMKQVLNSLFKFNLKYQDAVIRIELEKYLSTKEGKAVDNYQELYSRLIKIVVILLKTAFFDENPLFLNLTNGELDFIILSLLQKVLNIDGKEEKEALLIKTGKGANEISANLHSDIVKEKGALSFEDLAKYAVAAGVVWWSDPQIQKEYFRSKPEVLNSLYSDLEEKVTKGFRINDLPLFRKEVLNNKEETRILYFLDDNGELVWHLLWIKELLNLKSNLYVTVVVNELPITNNVNSSTLEFVLSDNSFFKELMDHPNFAFFEEKSFLPAIDLRFCSRDLLSKLEHSNIAVVNGVSFFEKIQSLPIPVYYLFTVYSHVSTIVTGLEKGDLIFARMPARTFAFGEIEEDADSVLVSKTLRQVHQQH